MSHGDGCSQRGMRLCKSDSLLAGVNRNDHETYWKPHPATEALDRAVQGGIGLCRRQRAAPIDTRNRVEWRNDRRLEASVVRRLTPNRLFAPRGPPTGWSEHRRERLSGLNKPALFSCEPMGGVEIVQSSLNGDASDRGICHRLTLAQSHGDQGS